MAIEPEVYPHKLPSNQKRVFFEGLKVLRPELVKMMREDDFIKGIKSRFGAVFVFKKNEATEIYKAGLKAITEIKGMKNETKQ